MEEVKREVKRDENIKRLELKALFGIPLPKQQFKDISVDEAIKIGEENWKSLSRPTTRPKRKRKFQYY